jgi:hypothetical protein
MWGGSFSGKGFGTGRENGGRKGPPIVWEGSFGLDSYLEAVYEFPVFTNENPLKGYDNRKEAWPKCMHGEDCLVHVQQRDGWRSSFLQMAVSMGSHYYYSFLIYVSLIFYNLHEIFVTVFRCSRKLQVCLVSRSFST